MAFKPVPAHASCIFDIAGLLICILGESSFPILIVYITDNLGFAQIVRQL